MHSPAVLALTLAALAAPAIADPPQPLSEAELRLGYGVSLSGTRGMASARSTPLTLSATGSIASHDLPLLAAYGGVVLETLDRTSAGATAGLRLTAGPLRLGGGATSLLAPHTLWGASASGGVCRRFLPRMELCGDVELTAFFAGEALVAGHTMTQVQAVLGVVIDAF